MISKLNLICNNKKESPVSIRLVINSFSGNSLEFSQSEQIINYFKSKDILPNEIMDLNQEMVFEKSKKLQGSFRSQFLKTGKIMKINKTPVIPQIIFNESLALNYTQFTNLAELNLIDKIATNRICCHFRFFEEKIVYPKIDFNNTAKDFSVKIENNNFISNFINLAINNCIYCLSNKKQIKRVKFFCNFRNSYDEETNQILEFCETNGVVLKIFDCENLNYFNNFSEFNKKDDNESMLQYYLKNSKRSEEKILLLDDQKIIIEDFFEKILSYDNISKNKTFEKCFICKRRILNKSLTGVSFKVNKCEICLQSRENIFSNSAIVNKKYEKKLGGDCLRNFKDKLSSQEKKINPYNFIEKLSMKEFYSENPEKSFFEKEEKSLEFSAENFKSLTGEISNDVQNIGSSNCKSMENEFSFLDF